MTDSAPFLPASSPSLPEASPIPPHLAAEFLLWLWWQGERNGGRFLPDLECWPDTRVSLASAGGDASASLSGHNPTASLEARAAVASGKIPKELRIGMRTGEAEFFATIKAPALDLAGVLLPQVVRSEGEEAFYDRWALLEELEVNIRKLLGLFTAVRIDETAWREVVASIAIWAREVEAIDGDPDSPAGWTDADPVAYNLPGDADLAGRWNVLGGEIQRLGRLPGADAAVSVRVVQGFASRCLAAQETLDRLMEETAYYLAAHVRG